MKKKIIAIVQNTTHFKEVSQSLLKLVKKLNVNLEIVLFVEPVVATEQSGIIPAINGVNSEEFHKLILDTEQEVQNAIGNLNGDLSGVDVTVKVEPKSLDYLVEKKSREKDVYMIVLPDDTFKEDISILTFFDKFSQFSHCPILRLPKDYRIETFSKILYATDYLEKDKMKIKKLVEIASAFGASITLLHVSQTNAIEKDSLIENSEIIRKEMDYNEIAVDKIYFDDVSKAVSDYALTNGFDLVAVLREKKSFVSNLFNKSESLEITKKAVQPVLMFYEHN